ncbi:hypothetical protein Q4577_03025 [Marinovum sp. 2_MG-2023]|uniref:hypothetical protein n=1 Tax=unclassified Marinovum TaxID=2647166 RepID=UPI0026E40DC7|nr:MULTISPECIES: hypothetical protein [unclassified Marinovum]MDO6728974.1 hypothetical protein [Marinovum sp. 2_MG-2023]MDO6779399.1 hypothetical protein [Marinovum sp. 1_MG-2023]
MSEGYEECLIIARSELATARRRLNAEIALYPTPISGCDAQFNHLLAKRGNVQQALQSLDRVIFVPTPRSPTSHNMVESR